MSTTVTSALLNFMGYLLVASTCISPTNTVMVHLPIIYFILSLGICAIEIYFNGKELKDTEEAFSKVSNESPQYGFWLMQLERFESRFLTSSQKRRLANLSKIIQVMREL